MEEGEASSIGPKFIDFGGCSLFLPAEPRDEVNRKWNITLSAVSKCTGSLKRTFMHPDEVYEG